MKQVKAKIISNRRLLPPTNRPDSRKLLGSNLMWLECPEVSHEAKPGQFVMVKCGEGTVLPRPFSVHQVNGDTLALFFGVWEDGKGTGWLGQRQTNETIEITGPLGNGFSIAPNSRKLLLVAGGLGIAPLRFLAHRAGRKGYAVTLLLGAPTSEQLYPQSNLTSDMELRTITEDGSAGFKGRATDLIHEYAKWADQVFACGPIGMYQDMVIRRTALGLEKKSVQVAVEVGMACGVGACLGCAIKTTSGMKDVCKDGPVFELGDVDWTSVVGTK